ncbi:MAG: hypothetical protein EOP20_08665, partial [Hyphomicrobiales bacterium]
MQISAAERRAIGLTIAGEIDPRMSPYSDPNTAIEAANILATIENRYQKNTPRAFGKAKAKSYTTRADVAKQPSQYSTWNDAKSRKTAKDNYAKFGPQIDKVIDGYYDGSVKPSVPQATHYYSPKAMAQTQGKKAPAWAGKMTDVAQQGAHVFGTIESRRAAQKLPDTGPVPTPADPVRMALANTPPRGLLGPQAPAPAALGLLGTPPAIGAAKALATMASAPAARTIAPAPSTVPVQRAAPISAAVTPNAIAATPATSPAVARAASVGLLSPTQEANLADRLGAPEQAVANRGLLGSPKLAPGTMLTANSMVAHLLSYP